MGAGRGSLACSRVAGALLAVVGWLVLLLVGRRLVGLQSIRLGSKTTDGRPDTGRGLRLKTPAAGQGGRKLLTISHTSYSQAEHWTIMKYSLGDFFSERLEL